MKKIILTASLAGLIFVGGCNHESAIKLETKEQKVSYAIGYNIGSSFEQQKLDIDQPVLIQAIKDAMNKSPKITDEEQKEILVNLQKEMVEQYKKDQEALAQTNIDKGKAFLTKNKLDKAVKTTKSGLQYKVIKKGSGKKSPSTKDTVSVHYRGTLLDGTEFDSSYKRNEPASFQVSRVIPGWTEALQKMKTGDKWKLFVPSELAYGANSPGGLIGPNETLLFEVELLSIK